MPITIATFYHFAAFPDFAERRAEYKSFMEARTIRGTILLAPEGINATVSGTQADIDALLAHLRQDPRFADLTHKESHSHTHPFQRTKVRLKKETISLGVPAHPAHATGTHIGADDWNALLDDPHVTVLDARNAYETHIGTFKNAITLDVDNFKQFPEAIRRSLDPAKHKKIAMYCTGGIRCEKLAPHMLKQGFEHIYQLDGGILHYLETTPEATSRWEGSCFVFDERVAVGHDLAACEDITMCSGCGAALLPQDRTSPHYRAGEQCGFCSAM